MISHYQIFLNQMKRIFLLFLLIVKVYISSWRHHWVKITLSCKSERVWESLSRCCCMCVLRYDWLPNRILDMAPTAVLTLPTLRGSTVSRHTRKTHANTRTQTQISEPTGSSTAGSNEGPIGGIQRTPHNCLTENPKLLMGTTLIFPFLKGSLFFFNLSLIPKCLVFQTAGGQSWGFVCVADGLAYFSQITKWS